MYAAATRWAKGGGQPERPSRRPCPGLTTEAARVRDRLPGIDHRETTRMSDPTYGFLLDFHSSAPRIQIDHRQIALSCRRCALPHDRRSPTARIVAFVLYAVVVHIVRAASETAQFDPGL